MTPADAQRAVANTETYVAAARAVGRTALTPDRIGESYNTEEGLRLDALDSDGAALAAAAEAAQQGLDELRTARNGIEQAWQGQTGSALGGFLDRQHASASRVVAGLQDAADTLRTLRAELARLTAEKEQTAVRIDDRRAGERGVWLAAAAVVLRGPADPADGAARDAADEIVRRDIAPYVNTDVASEWMPAMASATESVTAAYGSAVAALSSRGPVRFDQPAIPAVPTRSAHRVSARPTAPASPVVPVPPPVPAPVEAPTQIPMSAPMPSPLSGAALPADLGAAISPPPLPEMRGTAHRPKKRPAEPDGVTPDDGKGTEPADGPARQDHPTTAAAQSDSAPADRPEAPPPPPLPAAEAPAGAPIDPPVDQRTPDQRTPDQRTPDQRTPCDIAIDELPRIGQ